jgi:hypothetical protein
LDKHDAMIRRNLGMSENQAPRGTLDLDILAAPRVLIAIDNATLPDKQEKQADIVEPKPVNSWPGFT